MRLANSIRLLVAAMAILALTSVLSVARSAHAQVSIGISVGFPPPELPVYAQPICPGEGYIWTPGYWAWDPDDEDYYWVPGTWVVAPAVGLFWTPGYWAWGGSSFVFYQGYWGPVVGFYGGINYGYGYFGHGYEGGRWDGGRFYYNRTVNNINVTEIHNVYNTTVVNNNVNVTRVSYNGGNGGVNVRPTAQEDAVARERHMGPVATQTQHIQAARSNRELRASENHGKPMIAATQKPGSFSGSAVVPAREGGKYNPPPNRGANNANRPASTGRPESNANRSEGNANRPTYVHPNELPKVNRADRPPSTGNPKTDQKYQKEQEKLYQKQEQERQKLQQRQDQEHQRIMQQKTDDARRQQTEQRHQQQTQQMQQKHEQQQQRMEQRQQPRQQQAPPPRPNDKRPPNERP